MCSGTVFILLEMGVGGNNERSVSSAAHWVNKSGRSPLLSEDSISCLALSLFLLCTYAVDSRKSSQFVTFPIMGKAKPHGETLGWALGLLFYDVREITSNPERRKLSL